ncbi:MAG: HD domain-containing protein [Piscirickettsiaceae bacterium]|nr:HD domain-containing protein [Piscirickettsiaceae bacterium]
MKQCDDTLRLGSTIFSHELLPQINAESLNRKLFAVEQEKLTAYKQLERYSSDIVTIIKQREDAYNAVAMAHLDTLQRLAVAAEYKDDDTGVHILRMSNFSAIIARAYGMDKEYCRLLLQASPMHDIGKIGIPDRVLKKPGKLTEDEWEVMRKHPEYGYEILSGSEVPVIMLAAEIALAHHEKFDGSGYPNGLSGTEIPLSGRIVALADFFDAVTMDRCYRPAMTDDNAQSLIEIGKGKHFDPEVVDAFLSVLDELIATRDEINKSDF